MGGGCGMGQGRGWRAGCLETLVHALPVLRLAQGRSEEPSAAVLDSRTLRSTPESGGRAAWDGHKRTRGARLHLAVDRLGHPPAPHLTPADADDRSAVENLVLAVRDATSKSVSLA